jgi:hypothetical protein
MEAATIGFDADASMAFEEGTAAGLSPVISGDHPDQAENARRINALPFCARQKSRDITNFNLLDFHKELHKATLSERHAIRRGGVLKELPGRNMQMIC